VEDKRIRKMRPKQWKRHRRLEVWCELGQCAVVRVFDVPNGRLVQCSSEANIKEMRERGLVGSEGDWSKRRAFFLTEELLELGEQLTLICECQQTTERLASVRKINDLVGRKPRVSITAVLSD
jgi:hypothetical protein